MAEFQEPFPSKDPPPFFFLSNAKNSGQIFLFTDVKPFTKSYGSSPNIQPQHGLNMPYVSEGSGNGWTLALTARINPWYAYLVGSMSAGSARVGDGATTPWEEIVALETLIKEYGPSPQFLYHSPKSPVMKCILTQFSYEPPMQQSNLIGGKQVDPFTIPLQMSLVSYEDTWVHVS